MTENEYLILSNLSLDLKIAKSKLRIEEYVRIFGVNNVYVSFSGGKDSTVLLHLCRQLFPTIKGVYCDTGLEYPEVKQHVKLTENIEIIRPKIGFKEVLSKYGYPVVSKEQSQYIRQYNTAKSEKTKNTRINGNKWGRGKISEKWKFLINAPFKISDQCCDVMKKKPFKEYEKLTGRKPIIGTMACESELRKTWYLKNGCNAFSASRVKSTPIGFWNEQDVLNYIKMYNLKIPSVYGDILNNDNKLTLSGCDRTGCVYCLYGIHQEKGENRIQRLSKTHPELYNYCLNNLELKNVMDYMNIDY